MSESEEYQRAEVSKARGRNASAIKDPKKRREYIAAQGKLDEEGMNWDGKASDMNVKNEKLWSKEAQNYNKQEIEKREARWMKERSAQKHRSSKKTARKRGIKR